MASQKDIKSRISSVKNIRKITRAMEMVAAARLRRAVAEFADDFGYDLDEEGQPLEEREVGETTRAQEGLRGRAAGDGQEAGVAADEGDTAGEAEETSALRA